VHISTLGNLDGDVWRLILDNLNLDWPAGTAGTDAAEAHVAAPSDAALHPDVQVEESATEGVTP
jgi:hypothetical protein